MHHKHTSVKSVSELGALQILLMTIVIVMTSVVNKETQWPKYIKSIAYLQKSYECMPLNLSLKNTSCRLHFRVKSASCVSDQSQSSCESAEQQSQLSAEVTDGCIIDACAL